MPITMRQNLSTWLLISVISLGALACSRQSAARRDRLADKCQPFEYFAFQRSYPDISFDWKGWRRTLRQVKTTVAAQSKMEDCAGMQPNWVLQGPANVAGRCNTLAVKPDDENTLLAGFSAGGIFKSTDGGEKWTPVFDDHIELSIGDITYDPSNPQIVYAGTGDPNVPAIAYNGNGLYKSTDGGDTWSYLALSEKGVISKVIVDPTNPQHLIVGAMGNPYIRDNERGVYSSKDGGITWQQVLFVSNQTGVSDLVMSPTNPNILYASFWDRIRNNQESIVYGPNAKVYKSTDGGETWSQLSIGLPTGTLGRTGLALSATNPDKLYVVYIDTLSTPQGLYKTTNGGASFTPVNIGSLEDACADFGWYFGKIRLNPANDEDVYFLAILLWRKQPGSNNWFSAGGGHADSHDLVFTPSGRRYWANDGGVYRNDNGQSTAWTKSKNLPSTQFYHTTFNPHQPFIYWGGTQDNGIQKGAGGAAINNWTSVFSADGFRCAFHPDDPLTFWVEIQNGTIHKTTDGGVTWQFGSSALGTNDRVNWDAPFFMSRFSSSKLYAATFRVYVSAGNGWAPISGDLTDGIIFAPRFHTISCLNESPVLEDKLIAGTTDGNVWRREPTGNWVKINGNLPDRYVTSVQCSPTLPNRLFVTHSGFRDNETIPRVHRSDNNGTSWIDISGDLPQVPVNDLYIMPQQGDSVLFIGTDAGVYFTRDGGQHWNRLGANMPVIPVFDVEENPIKKELVAATFARGIYTMPFDSIFAQTPAVFISLSGTVSTETGAGVANVQFGNVKSLSNGNFNISQVPGCQDVVLEPYRNDNILNGLTTYDLVLISKHILGIEPLGSPYKMIAADANRSNSITTADIVSLRKLILGIDTTLANNTSWRFVPKAFDFPNPQNPLFNPFPEKIEVQTGSTPLQHLHFTAVKIGDVNNTVAPNLAEAAETRAGMEWPLGVIDTAFSAGQLATVTLNIPPGQLTALQLTLKFDPEILSFEPALSHTASEHLNLNLLEAGLLPIAFDDISNGLDLQLVFKAKQSGRLSGAIRIDRLPTPALAFDLDGNAYLPQLWGPDRQAFFEVRPNPFGRSGAVGMLRSTETTLSGHTLEILDIQGNIIASIEVPDSGACYLDANIFSASGIYFWRIRSLGLSGKLVFMP